MSAWNYSQLCVRPSDDWRRDRLDAPEVKVASPLRKRRVRVADTLENSSNEVRSFIDWLSLLCMQAREGTRANQILTIPFWYAVYLTCMQGGVRGQPHTDQPVSLPREARSDASPHGGAGDNTVRRIPESLSAPLGLDILHWSDSVQSANENAFGLHRNCLCFCTIVMPCFGSFHQVSSSKRQ